MRVRKPRDFAMMKLVAEWRETMARQNNVPRGRVVKDDAIYEICGHPPKSMQDIAQMRGLSRGFDRNRYGDSLLAVVKVGLELPSSELPTMPRMKKTREGSGAATEMLKVLLKVTVEAHGVAAKVIATVDDLEKIAADDNADVAALKGWRRELFGNTAIKLKNGQIALGIQDKTIKVIAVGDVKAAAE